MRELKFRAWKMRNGKLQRYVCTPFGLFDYAQEHPEAPVLHYEQVNDIRDFMPDADVIEQYTGLKDKNGKEIYEGDILKLRGRVYEVKFDNYGQFCLENKKYHWLSSDYSFRSVDVWCAEGILVEKIGNIHENPELLGEEVTDDGKERRTNA